VLRLGGDWYAFWNGTAWKDPVAADFDGDGRTDLAARLAGQWWVGLTSAAGGQKSLSNWGAWTEAAWTDLRAADFNGDGRADLAARLSGRWYVARSTGSKFATSDWGGWPAGNWKAVAATDVTGPPQTGSGAGPLDAVPAASATVATTRRDYPPVLLWSSPDDGERLADRLLGGS
jgi:hypothetical protein